MKRCIIFIRVSTVQQDYLEKPKIYIIVKVYYIIQIIKKLILQIKLMPNIVQETHIIN